MYLTVLIVLFFLWRLLLNYNRGVLLITAWVLVLDMLSLPINMTVFQLLAFFSCLLGAYHHLGNKKRWSTFPFWGCALAMGISITITNCFSREAHWPASIMNIISTYIFPLCVWDALERPKNMKAFIRYTIIFLMSMVIYGIYEEVTMSNPIMTWLSAHEMTTSAVGLSESIRFGLKRIQSFLAYSGALGTCCIINALFILYVNDKHKAYIRTFSYIVPILVFGLYLCALFTGSRSIIAAVVIGSLYFVRGATFRYKWTWIVILLAFIILPFVLPYFREILTAFEDTESVGGSNTEMRQGQFELALYFMRQSPWYGNGIGFTSSFVTEYFKNEIFGAESVWLPLMMNQGIIGIVAYLIVLFIPLRYCVKLKNYIGIFIILAFITAKTLSSIPGMSAAYFLIYVIATSRLIIYQQGRVIPPSYNANLTS